MNVEELRQNGYKVRVSHFRYVIEQTNQNFTWVLRSRRQIMDEDGTMEYVNPRGGLTKVEITTPEGADLVGYANCSLSDGFQRKEGLRIALERVMKKCYIVSHNGVAMKSFNKRIAAECWISFNGATENNYGWCISEDWANVVNPAIPASV